MIEIWKKQFDATYIRQDGVIVLNDADIPLPEGFKVDLKFRSNILFPPNSRAGDHFHSIREEVFVGFGAGMQLLIEDPDNHESKIFDIDPSKNGGKYVAFWIQTKIPHAVRNNGPEVGYLIEFASHPQEKTDYPVGERI